VFKNNKKATHKDNLVILGLTQIIKVYGIACYRGFKKVKLSKLKTKKYRLGFIVFSVFEIACLVNLILFHNPISLLYITLSIPALSLLDLFNVENRQIIKVSKAFKKHNVYNRIGANGYYPKLVNITNNDNSTIYNFYSNGNKLNIFESNTDTLEHAISKGTKSYCRVVKVNKSYRDTTIFEVLTANKPLITCYSWNLDLVQEAYNNNQSIFLGIGYFKKVLINFAEIPHLFIAGETGGGKGNITKSIVLQILYRSMFEDIKLTVIDFKEALDYQVFQNTFTVLTEIEQLQRLIDSLMIESKKRSQILLSKSCENITEYNKLSNVEKMPRYFIVADEAVDAFPDTKKDSPMAKMKDDLTKLVRKSRAVGIHFVLTTQLPSTAVFGNQLKNNIPGRLCGRFADESASRIVLDNNQASKLPEIKGRMLYKVGAELLEVQTPKTNNTVVSWFVTNNKHRFKIDSHKNKTLNLDKSDDKQVTYDLKEFKKNL
jgi:S-DNA-T family DNA segregation ATPase FtsK/SpoIIIE